MKKVILLFALALSFSGVAQAQQRMYEVTVTNLTAGQSFTPLIAVTHSNAVSLFELGQPASPELEMLAEGGATMPLQDSLAQMYEDIFDINTSSGLLGPGESVTMEVSGGRGRASLSIAGMLLPTHDTFVALNGVSLPYYQAVFDAFAYDAGTEHNDELCVNIPGPLCGGEPVSAEGGEGYVFPANGIHGIGDLDPAVYDWRNQVARVVVRRIR